MTHSRWMRRLLPLVTLLALGGCAAITGSDLEPVAGELRAQRQKWEAQRLDDYRFTVSRSCFCPEEATQPARVEVRGGEVVKVTSLGTGQELDLRLGFTIDQLFAWIGAAGQDGTYLDVRYHPQRGYPAQATIGTLANDAGTAYALYDLEPLR